LYLRLRTIRHNGYKVYWQDGGKLYHQKKGIIDVIENLNYDQIKFTANEDLIHYIDTVDEALYQIDY
jgi:phosphomannomutase